MSEASEEPLKKAISETARAFDAYLEEYDAWYESGAGATLLAIEVEALRPLLSRHPRPYLEVGVGTGRFAQALGVECGVDPAVQLLGVARERGIVAVQGIGEQLPFKGGSFGAVLLAFTLCFVADPRAVLNETARVLRGGGGLVVGILPRGSPWANLYAQRGREGHPLYRRARFFSVHEVEALLLTSGFQVVEYTSTLLQTPGKATYALERPRSGYRAGASFIAMQGAKK